MTYRVFAVISSLIKPLLIFTEYGYQQDFSVNYSLLGFTKELFLLCQITNLRYMMLCVIIVKYDKVELNPDLVYLQIIITRDEAI